MSAAPANIHATIVFLDGEDHPRQPKNGGVKKGRDKAPYLLRGSQQCEFFH